MTIILIMKNCFCFTLNIMLMIYENSCAPSNLQRPDLLHMNLCTEYTNLKFLNFSVLTVVVKYKLKRRNSTIRTNLFMLTVLCVIIAVMHWELTVL